MSFAKSMTCDGLRLACLRVEGGQQGQGRERCEGEEPEDSHARTLLRLWPQVNPALCAARRWAAGARSMRRVLGIMHVGLIDGVRLRRNIVKLPKARERYRQIWQSEQGSFIIQVMMARASQPMAHSPRVKMVRLKWSS